jgi:hypothetical protein
MWTRFGWRSRDPRLRRHHVRRHARRLAARQLGRAAILTTREHFVGCDGNGWEDCWYCAGEGWFYSSIKAESLRCIVCDGTGVLTCPACDDSAPDEAAVQY